jgi:Raf kinase inhibitor-like YbhB/YbcL family protein
MGRWAASVLACLLLLTACSEARQTDATRSGTMELTSPAFENDDVIPTEHTCDGADQSPPLAWSGAPDGTRAFALLVTDPDAGGFVHWALADIPGDRTELAAGEGDSVGTAARNNFGRPGWGGPCPPSGEHRYVFTLYALDEPMGLTDTPDPSLVQGALQGRVLAEAELTGRYARGG